MMRGDFFPVGQYFQKADTWMEEVPAGKGERGDLIKVTNVFLFGGASGREPVAFMLRIGRI